MQINYQGIFIYILEIIFFLIFVVIFRFILKKIKERPYKILNPTEYFPEEEIHSLRQTYYLIMMGLLFIVVLYAVVYYDQDLLSFAVYDVIISLYVATGLDMSTLKNKVLQILIVPFGSLYYLILGTSIFEIVTIIHIPVFIYLIKVYYDKFREYTESNGLGIAVILLFSIVFVSFFITQVFESVNPLDALVMVSNAFTSNGYAVLGTTIGGKINSIFLVWGGYLLSGVATATLTAAILKKHFDIKNEELSEKIDKLDSKNKELNEKLDNLDSKNKVLNEKLDNLDIQNNKLNEQIDKLIMELKN